MILLFQMGYFYFVVCRSALMNFSSLYRLLELNVNLVK